MAQSWERRRAGEPGSEPSLEEQSHSEAEEAGAEGRNLGKLWQGHGWETGSLADLKAFTCILAHAASSRVLHAALGEREEVGPPPPRPGLSSSISSSPAVEARGLNLSQLC